jgi:glutathione S-transferase
LTRARLYWMAPSHPSQAARKMLDLKGVDYDLVGVLPLNQRIHLRLAGFRGGTVPALKIDGRRIQGSTRIARALDELVPEPALFPADPALRARVEEAERWGEERLQPVPRRMGRYGAVYSTGLRRWAAQASGMPLEGIAIRITGPLIRYYGRTVEADGQAATEKAVRADVAALGDLVGRADELLADGVLSTDPPNAATLQVLSSVRFLDACADLHPYIGAAASARAARELFPDYPEPVPPFLPEAWLEPLRERGPAALRART